jgi:hypothetical protein
MVLDVPTRNSVDRRLEIGALQITAERVDDRRTPGNDRCA